MKNELLHHRLSYAVLICALSFFIVFFLGLWPNRMYERIAVAALVGFYILWGIITHLRSDHISRHIISEYITISLLAGVMLFLITL